MSLCASAVALGDNTLSVTCSVGGQSVKCDQGSWFQSPSSVTWHVDPVPTNVNGCISTTYDDISATVSCQVWWGSVTQLISFPLNVETSVPSVSAAPSRPPDVNGWYNHPVAASFIGRSFSGIASCTAPVTYSGPDSPSAGLDSSCTDNAGKTASANPIAYDATPPSVSALPSRQPDHNGWYNHPVTFAFGGTDATSGIAGCSTVTYSGPASGSATVTGSCSDRAGNV